MNSRAPISGIDTGLPAFSPDHLDPSPWAKIGQLRHLCKIGMAANDTNLILEHMDASFEALFEVMHRIAAEMESEMNLMTYPGQE